MTLIDSSVWIDLFRNLDTLQTRTLKHLLRTQPIVTADLVLVEVLQGVRNESDHRRALDLLTRPGVMPISNAKVAIQAATYYRALRAKGITIRKTIDTLLATRCIMDRIPLLYSDRDFDPFVEHFGLRSALHNSGVA